MKLTLFLSAMLIALPAAGAEKQEEKVSVKFIGMINSNPAFKPLRWVIKRYEGEVELKITSWRFDQRLPGGKYNVKVSYINQQNSFDFEVIEDNQEVITNFET